MSKNYIPSKISGNKGEAKALLLFTESNLLVRSQHQNDFGVDIEVELTVADEEGKRTATGLLAKIQVKHRAAQSKTITLDINEIKYYKGLLNVPLFYILITDSNQYSICHYHSSRRNLLEFNTYSNLYLDDGQNIVSNNEQIPEMIKAIQDFHAGAEASIVVNILREIYRVHSTSGAKDLTGMVVEAIIVARANANSMTPNQYKLLLLGFSGMQQGLRTLLSR